MEAISHALLSLSIATLLRICSEPFQPHSPLLFSHLRSTPVLRSTILRVLASCAMHVLIPSCCARSLRSLLDVVLRLCLGGRFASNHLELATAFNARGSPRGIRRSRRGANEKKDSSATRRHSEPIRDPLDKSSQLAIKPVRFADHLILDSHFTHCRDTQLAIDVALSSLR